LFPDILNNGIWHTTSVERYKGILITGSIHPEPTIPDTERWSSADNPNFVRSLGGVSLFEFSAFDAESYTARYPLSMWRNFVPCCQKWSEAIWIEIDRKAIQENFLDREALLGLWREGIKHGTARNIMPLIEAAHIGSIPVSVFLRVLKYSKNNEEFTELSPIRKIDGL
jgi:hypothetical protein